MAATKLLRVMLNKSSLNAYISRLIGWRLYSIAFVLGCVTALGLEPVNFFPACFVGFSGFALILHQQHEKNQKPFALVPLLTGWCFGFGYFLAGLWWLSAALFVDHDEFLWALPLVIFAFPAFLALYWSIAAVIALSLWRCGVRALFALAFAFGLCEWLRGNAFTGFPWNALSYTAMPSPLFMQSAALFGVYGLNCFAVFVYATPSLFFWNCKRWASLAITFCFVGFHVLFGMWRLSAPVTFANEDGREEWLRLVQPSIAQNVKVNSGERADILQRHLDLTLAPVAKGHQQAKVIIWPESAVPYILQFAPNALSEIAASLTPQQTILLGSVRLQESTSGDGKRYYNSLQAMNAAGEIFAHSDKMHLVPFGEYLPFEKLLRHFGLRAIADSVGGYSAARSRRSVALSRTLIYLPLICYEIIFPTGVDYEGKRATFIVNVTNDAWYGNTPGPYQHFQQARVRAVEQGLPLARAANNGISAVTDPYGRIVAALGLNEIGDVDAPLPEPIVPFWHSGPGNLVFFAILVFFFAGNRIRCRRINRH